MPTGRDKTEDFFNCLERDDTLRILLKGSNGNKLRGLMLRGLEESGLVSNYVLMQHPDFYA